MRKEREDLFYPDSIEYDKRRFNYASMHLSNTQNNPKDPIEFNIKRLIDRIEPQDRESLIYEIPQLIKAAKNPKAAKRKWITNLYKAKRWIDSKKAIELERMNNNCALARLEEVCLKKVTLKAKECQVRRYPLPKPGKKLGDYIRNRLISEGLDIAQLKIRSIYDVERVSVAVKTGNDRDNMSMRHGNYHGGYDGEELAMIRYGITNAGDTTYLSDLVRWESSEDQEKIAILIYYSDAVEGIGPSGYMKSNGFHAFHFSGEIKQRSLLAVFER